MQNYALLGEKLGHSLSPLIHRHILDMLGEQGNYINLELVPDRLPDVPKALMVLGFAGVNVTIPYKQKIMPYLDEIAPEAARIGAVNTICLRDGRAVGHNTDYAGFSLMLQAEGIAVAGQRAVVLGAGGAAAAAVAALLDAGAASVTVLGRDPARLEELHGRFPAIAVGMLAAHEQIAGDLLVNTTPVGMHPQVDGCPLPERVIGRFAAVADCVYNPTPTVLVRTASRLGLRACCGLSMLVFQAVRAQEIWQQRTIAPALAKPICDELERMFVVKER